MNDAPAIVPAVRRFSANQDAYWDARVKTQRWLCRGLLVGAVLLFVIDESRPQGVDALSFFNSGATLVCALAIYPLRGRKMYAYIGPDIEISTDGVTVHSALVRFLPWQHLDGRACRLLDDRITLVYRREFWKDPLYIRTVSYPMELSALLKARISSAS